MGKTHTLIVRGLTKDQKNSLKRLAKAKNRLASVNSFMLDVIDDKTIHDIETFKIKQQNGKENKG